MKPKVSVCCLAYNHEQYIAHTLDRMLSQKVDFPIEILIHDDASKDSTPEIIRAYAEKNPQVIRPILQTENQYSRGIHNISGLFNFPRAQGDYIAMCEGDDYWCDDTKLARQVEYMEAHPDCTMVFHSARMVSEDGALVRRMMRPYHGDQIISPERIIDKTSGYPTASLLLRTDIMKKLPDFYMNCPIGDIPMQLLMASEGYAYYMDRPMCVYRFGIAGSWTCEMLSGDYRRKQETYALQMKEMYEEYDRYTEGRFHQQTVRAWERIYYQTRVNLKEWDTVYNRKYADYRRELGMRDRFFFALERNMPGVYKSLQKLWQNRKTI